MTTASVALPSAYDSFAQVVCWTPSLRHVFRTTCGDELSSHIVDAVLASQGVAGASPLKARLLVDRILHTAPIRPLLDLTG